MHVRQTPVSSPRPFSSARPSVMLCLAAVLIACTLALAGCGHASPANSATVKNCGTSRTAANVPIEVEVNHGQVSCAVALTVEASYAKAIVDGKAPGNGGGGPVPVNGWTCQGFPTPELLKTGDASKCARDGTEILAILKTPS
jgi:hypothetical protein